MDGCIACKPWLSVPPSTTLNAIQLSTAQWLRSQVTRPAAPAWQRACRHGHTHMMHQCPPTLLLAPALGAIHARQPYGLASKTHPRTLSAQITHNRNRNPHKATPAQLGAVHCLHTGQPPRPSPSSCTRMQACSHGAPVRPQPAAVPRNLAQSKQASRTKTHPRMQPLLMYTQPTPKNPTRPVPAPWRCPLSARRPAPPRPPAAPWPCWTAGAR